MSDKKRIRNIFGSKAPSAYQAIKNLCLTNLPSEDRKLLETEDPYRRLSLSSHFPFEAYIPLIPELDLRERILTL